LAEGYNKINNNSENLGVGARFLLGVASLPSCGPENILL